MRVEDALARGVGSEHLLIAGRCRSLLTRPEALWVFASTEGVEPTNNTAERAIRPLVILRKLSYGTQSAAGSRFVETVQTILKLAANKAATRWSSSPTQSPKPGAKKPLPHSSPPCERLHADLGRQADGDLLGCDGLSSP